MHVVVPVPFKSRTLLVLLSVGPFTAMLLFLLHSCAVCYHLLHILLGLSACILLAITYHLSVRAVNRLKGPLAVSKYLLSSLCITDA